jgi:hypothetical protein
MSLRSAAQPGALGGRCSEQSHQQDGTFEALSISAGWSTLASKRRRRACRVRGVITSQCRREPAGSTVTSATLGRHRSTSHSVASLRRGCCRQAHEQAGGRVSGVAMEWRAAGRKANARGLPKGNACEVTVIHGPRAVLPCCMDAGPCYHAARAWRPQRSRPTGRRRGAAGSPSAGFASSDPRAPPVYNGRGVGGSKGGGNGSEAAATAGGERKAECRLGSGSKGLPSASRSAPGCLRPHVASPAAAGTTSATMPARHPRRVARTDHLGHLGGSTPPLHDFAAQASVWRLRFASARPGVGAHRLRGVEHHRCADSKVQTHRGRAGEALSSGLAAGAWGIRGAERARRGERREAEARDWRNAHAHARRLQANTTLHCAIRMLRSPTLLPGGTEARRITNIFWGRGETSGPFGFVRRA